MANGTFNMYGLMGDLTFKDGVGGPSDVFILQYGTGGAITQVSKRTLKG
jgi:hypothetical protein